MNNEDRGFVYTIIKSSPSSTTNTRIANHKTILPYFKAKLKEPRANSKPKLKTPIKSIHGNFRSQENSFILPEVDHKLLIEPLKGNSLERNKYKIRKRSTIIDKKTILKVLDSCRKLIKNKKDFIEEEGNWGEMIIEKLNKKSSRNIRIIRDLINSETKIHYKNELIPEKSKEIVLKKEEQYKNMEKILDAFDNVDSELDNRRKGSASYFRTPKRSLEEINYGNLYQEGMREGFEIRVKNYIREAEVIQEKVIVDKNCRYQHMKVKKWKRKIY